MECSSLINSSYCFSPPTQVLEDQQNIRLIRELLQTLYTSLCTLVQRVGKSVLVGNINRQIIMCSLDTLRYSDCLRPIALLSTFAYGLI